MTNTTLRAELKAAKQSLTDAGWTHTHSVMHDGGATGDFGSCFIKDGKTFYLNILTYKTLPL